MFTLFDNSYIFQCLVMMDKSTSFFWLNLDSIFSDKMATETAKVDLGVLEEDDEFEEFPADGTGISTFYYLSLSPWTSILNIFLNVLY